MIYQISPGDNFMPSNNGQHCPGNPDGCDECDYLICCFASEMCDQCFAENGSCEINARHNA